MVRNWLAARAITLDGLVHDRGHATAFTTIVADRARNRLAFHHPGALAKFAYADIPQALLAAAEVLLVTSYTILPQLRSGGFAQALRGAQQRGAITAVDIGPAIGEPAQLRELALLLPDVDYLIANQHELAVCAGVDTMDEAASSLIKAGARCVIVKLGRDGAAIFGNGRRERIPAFDVHVHATIGAGDAFNAGFLYGVRAGRSLAEAARIGNAVAALVVSGERGILGSPSLEQVQAFLQKQGG
jgi:sugar/nucleoside kinase (ribokinase family)